MPVIKSAIKKLRKDRKREKENEKLRRALERAIRLARKSPSKISAAYSVVDRAVKKNIIHKNKAARIKSSLAKLTKTKIRTISKKSALKTKTASIPKKNPRKSL